MRCVLLGLALIACGPPTRFPESDWKSAPPPPKPAPVQPKPTMAMRQAPAPRNLARRIEDKISQRLDAKPSPYRACPATEMAMAVTRNIDGRVPAESMPVSYALDHKKPVVPADFFAGEIAIQKIIALETAQPIVVPAGFRKDVVVHGRDPEFRLFMARCELAYPHTLRRAGYDAAMAVLLGAAPEVALPLIKQSIYPDGPLATSCRASTECNGVCDPVAKVCTSPRAKTAAMLSFAESMIEDALVRAFAGTLTRAEIERARFTRDSVAELMTYGRYVRCGGELCNIVRKDIDGRTQLVFWDRRYRGERHPLDVEPWEACYRATQSTSRGNCIAKCDSGVAAKRASCEATCTSLCPVDPPRSPGTDDD